MVKRRDNLKVVEQVRRHEKRSQQSLFAASRGDLDATRNLIEHLRACAAQQTAVLRNCVLNGDRAKADHAKNSLAELELSIEREQAELAGLAARLEKHREEFLRARKHHEAAASLVDRRETAERQTAARRDADQTDDNYASNLQKDGREAMNGHEHANR